MAIEKTYKVTCDHCNQEIKDEVFIDASVYGKVAHITCLLKSMTVFSALKFIGIDDIYITNTETQAIQGDLIKIDPIKLKALVP